MVGAAVCALMVPVVALFAYEVGSIYRLDHSIFRGLVQPEGSGAFEFFNLVTSIGNPLPFLAVLAGLVGFGLRAGRRRETAAALAVVVGANVSTQVFKHLLEHPRWDHSLGILQPSMDAFPSGHTTAAASLAVALALIVPPRLRTVAVAVGAAVTAIVGFGLVVIGAHYPSDVLGGLFVVGAWGFAAVAALRLWRLRSPEAPPQGEKKPGSGGFAVSLR
jgi:membrane-associated phospholipid phosphatase